MNAPIHVDNSFLSFAERHELALLEVHAGQKRPVGDDWPSRSSKDRATWELWRASGSNIGVHAGASNIATVDIEAGRWEIAAEWFRSVLGMEIPDPHVSSARGGWHIFFRLPDGFKCAKLKFTWGELIVGNNQTVAPPSYFDGAPEGKASGEYRFFSKTTELYDGAPLLKLWQRKERAAAVEQPALNNYAYGEVQWWLDRKVAGDWKDDSTSPWCDQGEWIFFGMALKLHFPNEDGFELWMRATHDGHDKAAERWNSANDFKPEYAEGMRTLHRYLDRDISWMFREMLGCPMAPRPSPSPIDIPVEILKQYNREREQYQIALLGPLPDHPYLTAPQANVLAKFWAHLPSGKMIYEGTREMWTSGSLDKHIGRVKDAMKTEGPGTLASTFLSQHRAVKSMGWAPGEPMIVEDKVLTNEGWLRSPGDLTFNRYLAPDIEHVEGDVSKWLNHIKLIYPEEWRHIVMWFAHRVQRPGEKVNHCLDFIGPQGIGKDTIVEPVIAAIGKHNFQGIAAWTKFTISAANPGTAFMTRQKRSLQLRQPRTGSISNISRNIRR